MSYVIISIDFETWNTVPIQAGIWAYLNGLRILMMAWHIQNDPAPVELWRPGMPFPEKLHQAIQNGAKIAGWNAMQFERLVWREVAVRDHGFPAVSDNVWLDSMHLASGANLPRGLDACAKALGAPEQKDSSGRVLMLRVTNGKRTPWPPKEEDLIRLGEYCKQDVITEESVVRLLPPWFDIEPWRRAPEIDRKINDRGILIDVPLVEGLAKAATVQIARLSMELKELTAGAVPAVTRIEALKQWLLSQGVKLPRKDDPAFGTENEIESETEDDEEEEKEKEKDSYRLRKSDIADLLARDDVPEACRRALEIRVEAAKASVAKLKRMATSVCADGRLRSMLTLGGAQATMRWSGSGVQPQNLIRDVIANDDEVALQNGLNLKTDSAEVQRLANICLQNAIDAGRSGDADLINMLFTMTRKDNQGRFRTEGAMFFISRMLRRVFRAAPGKTLLQGDYSQIEARIPMWLAGQENMVQAYARGDDVYRLTAGPIFSIAPEDLPTEKRQCGKVVILACGFGGGVNAFVPMAMNYGLRVSRAEAEPIVRGFRESNTMLTAYWSSNLACARMAIENPGYIYAVPPKWLVSWRMVNNCLMCRLPSGRVLRYWGARLIEGKWADGTPKAEPDISIISVKGKAVYRRTLWHGLAVENQVQAIAADILLTGLDNMERASFEVNLHVHDSIAAEEEICRAKERLEEFKACMLDVPGWAAGLPVAAKCHINERFG